MNDLKVKTLKITNNNCGRQEEPANLISKLLPRMRRMYVVNTRLDFH